MPYENFAANKVRAVQSTRSKTEYATNTTRLIVEHRPNYPGHSRPQLKNPLHASRREEKDLIEEQPCFGKVLEDDHQIADDTYVLHSTFRQAGLVLRPKYVVR